MNNVKHYIMHGKHWPDLYIIFVNNISKKRGTTFEMKNHFVPMIRHACTQMCGRAATDPSAYAKKQKRLCISFDTEARLMRSLHDKKSATA